MHSWPINVVTDKDEAMRVNRVRVAVAVLVLAVGLGACGKDSISKADFLVAGGKICKGINTKLMKINEVQIEGEPTPAQQQQFLIDVTKIFEDATKELSGLEVPSEGKDTVEAFIAAMKKGTAEIKAASQSPEAATELLNSSRDPMEKANVLADKYGLTECGAQQ